MAKVNLQNITKIFHDDHHNKDVKAVNDFSCKISDGEFVTILGPSGCGKTTALRMIAGFETPTSGEIYFDTTLVNHLPPNKRNSSMVFQNYAVFPHMNVEENITYGLKIKKVSKPEIKDRAKKVIEIVGLTGFEKRSPNQLSGGQQQRVALARALIVEPKVLLFDEPLSNLDAKLRESMRVEIRRIQKELSITAIYVTHDQVEAMAISDRIIVMNRGKIEQIGKPWDIYARPTTHFVADFMGGANFIEAVIKDVNKESVNVDINGVSIDIPYVMPDITGGNRVKLVIRPENIIYTDPNNGLFSGVIIDQNYLGGLRESEAKLDNGLNLIARVPVNVTGKNYINSDRVGIRFKTENLHYVKS